MALVDAARNSMLDKLGTIVLYASLHSASPGTTGVNEIAGGSPAYARTAVTWAAASGSVLTANGTLPVFNVESGDTVAFAGLWSAVSGGTFYGSGAVTSHTFANQGTYTLTAITVTQT